MKFAKGKTLMSVRMTNTEYSQIMACAKYDHNIDTMFKGRVHRIESGEWIIALNFDEMKCVHDSLDKICQSIRYEISQAEYKAKEDCEVADTRLLELFLNIVTELQIPFYGAAVYHHPSV